MDRTDPVLMELIANWNPDKRPRHCSNCSRARVFGSPVKPLVRCHAGYGETELWRLIRPSNPGCFSDAMKCVHFDPAG